MKIVIILEIKILQNINFIENFKKKKIIFY